jgi:tetratricopeptide (TPR) repeat protein
MQRSEASASLSFDEAKVFFDLGHFDELVRRSRRLARPFTDCDLQLLVAHAMVMVGNIAEAKDLATGTFDNTPTVRAHASLVLGLIEHASGALTTAAHHFRTAVRIANESRNANDIAWALVYLLNHLVNVEPNEAVMALLPHVRRAVTRAGDPQAIAYLHQAITVLEGQTGGLDEARRHCDVADSILALSPNVWLATNSLLNRACIDMLTCRYSAAEKEIESAKRRCANAGLARGIAIADSNLGHVQLQRGDFDRALKSFRRTMDSAFTSTFARLGALEGTARVHLALGQLEECESTLRRLEDSVKADSKLSLMYHVRWSAITKARLRLRAGNSALAISELLQVENRIEGIHDKPLEAAIHLTLAQALWAEGRHRDCAERLLRADRIGITRLVELQGQFYWATAGLLGDGDAALSRTLVARAQMLWQQQGIQCISREMPLPLTF